MLSHRDRLEKVLAIAINPGAYEEEAVAALHKARELVRKDPKLAHLLPSLAYPSSKPRPASPGETSLECSITDVSDFWLPILLNNLSEHAYELGLKSKITCDFATPTTVDIRCDGTPAACEAFQEHLNLIIEYIKSRKREN